MAYATFFLSTAANHVVFSRFRRDTRPSPQERWHGLGDVNVRFRQASTFFVRLLASVPGEFKHPTRSRACYLLPAVSHRGTRAAHRKDPKENASNTPCNFSPYLPAQEIVAPWHCEFIQPCENICSKLSEIGFRRTVDRVNGRGRTKF